MFNYKLHLSAYLDQNFRLICNCLVYNFLSFCYIGIISHKFQQKFQACWSRLGNMCEAVLCVLQIDSLTIYNISGKYTFPYLILVLFLALLCACHFCELYVTNLRFDVSLNNCVNEVFIHWIIMYVCICKLYPLFWYKYNHSQPQLVGVTF